jgi:hypothetical protein
MTVLINLNITKMHNNLVKLNNDGCGIKMNLHNRVINIYSNLLTYIIKAVSIIISTPSKFYFLTNRRKIPIIAIKTF